MNRAYKLSRAFLGILMMTLSLSSLSFGATADTSPTKTNSSKTVKTKKKKIIKAAPAAAKPMTIKQSEPAQITPKESSVMAWLKDLRSRVTKSKAKQNQIVAVAAVRGNETPDSPPLYWKGKKTSGNVEMPELSEFESALDQAIAGNSADSKEKLKQFVSNYPQSPLVDDANEALQKLEEQPASQ